MSKRSNKANVAKNTTPHKGSMSTTPCAEVRLEFKDVLNHLNAGGDLYDHTVDPKPRGHRGPETLYLHSTPERPEVTRCYDAQAAIGKLGYQLTAAAVIMANVITDRDAIDVFKHMVTPLAEALQKGVKEVIDADINQLTEKFRNEMFTTCWSELSFGIDMMVAGLNLSGALFEAALICLREKFGGSMNYLLGDKLKEMKAEKAKKEEKAASFTRFLTPADVEAANQAEARLRPREPIEVDML